MRSHPYPTEILPLILAASHAGEHSHEPEIFDITDSYPSLSAYNSRPHPSADHHNRFTVEVYPLWHQLLLCFPFKPEQ